MIDYDLSVLWIRSATIDYQKIVAVPLLQQRFLTLNSSFVVDTLLLPIPPTDDIGGGSSSDSSDCGDCVKKREREILKLSEKWSKRRRMKYGRRWDLRKLKAKEER